jgi:putative PIN family toxin of toxin-antitoxin system
MGPQTAQVMKRVVLDTNVLISAYAFKGQVAALRPLWQAGHLRLLFSTETWNELVLAAQYPKLKWSHDSQRELLEGAVVPVSERAIPYAGPLRKACRDPQDEIFLRLALGAQADALVSGDKDLLALEGHYPFPILKPADLKARFFFDFMAGEDVSGLELPRQKAIRKPRVKKK